VCCHPAPAPSHRSEREFKLATFQQLVTTPTVKEHPASSLQNNPICALLTARPGKQSPRHNQADLARQVIGER
jgi:hypothetical protein